MSKKTVFVTFGGGEQNYVDAAIRISKQAYSTRMFSKIFTYTLDFLKQDPEFWVRHSDFIMNNPRGCGYWLWKPYIIMKTLEQLNDGDIIFYADGGCEFNAIRNKQMPRMFRAVSFDKMICSSTQHRENEWCKMDLIVELGMNEPNYLHSVQFQASSIIIEVCDKTRQFIKEWYELCCIYHFIDDTPSVIPNCANFIEHRHDQSVFSLLFKKYELPFNTTVMNTIIIARNRSGTPMRNMHSNKITFL
jgi:hypothetical protein